MSVNWKWPLTAVGIALAALVAAFALGASARAIVVAPLMLLAPGYALTLAIFGARYLDPAERLLYSAGLNLALLILGGLLLNLTPWGLHPLSWAIFLAAITLGGATIAVRRGAALPARALPKLRRPTGWQQSILLGLAALVLSAAIGLALSSAQSKTATATTQLWLLPVAGTGAAQVQLGLDNLEPATTRYRLMLQADGQIIQEWSSLELPSGGRWETTLTLPPGAPNKPTIDAILYRSDAPDRIYRQVRLWREGQR